MSEKVKLPKAVCNALGLVKVGLSNYEIVFACKNQLFGNKYYNHIESMVECLNEADEEKLMRALVLGYELELTPEEQLKERYENRGDFCTYEHFLGYRDGVKDALHLHGIKYDWIKGWGEDDAE